MPLAAALDVLSLLEPWSAWKSSQPVSAVRFLELLRALVDGGVDFVVVDGVAAVLEGAPVSTFDLDIVYSPRNANLARLMEVLALDAVYVDPAGRRLSPTEERLRGGGHHLLRTRFGRLDVMGSEPRVQRASTRTWLASH